ncbi:1117_t:CDS:1, partial [Racocetra persica]
VSSKTLHKTLLVLLNIGEESNDLLSNKTDDSDRTDDFNKP